MLAPEIVEESIIRDVETKIPPVSLDAFYGAKGPTDKQVIFRDALEGLVEESLGLFVQKGLDFHSSILLIEVFYVDQKGKHLDELL